MVPENDPRPGMRRRDRKDGLRFGASSGCSLRDSRRTPGKAWPEPLFDLRGGSRSGRRRNKARFPPFLVQDGFSASGAFSFAVELENGSHDAYQELASGRYHPPRRRPVAGRFRGARDHAPCILRTRTGAAVGRRSARPATSRTRARRAACTRRPCGAGRGRPACSRACQSAAGGPAPGRSACAVCGSTRAPAPSRAGTGRAAGLCCARTPARPSDAARGASHHRPGSPGAGSALRTARARPAGDRRARCSSDVAASARRRSCTANPPGSRSCAACADACARSARTGTARHGPAAGTGSAQRSGRAARDAAEPVGARPRGPCARRSFGSARCAGTALDHACGAAGRPRAGPFAPAT